MASRNISTTYTTTTPGIWGAPVNTSAISVSTTFLDQDFNPATLSVD